MKKVCTKCGENKSLENYYKDIRAKDGKMSACKSCHNVIQKNYNAEYYNAEYHKEYRTKHKQRISENNKKYYAKNRQKFLRKQKEYQIKYRKTDKGKAAVARGNNKRRINISNTRCTLSDKEWNYIIYNCQNNKCARCGRTFTKELKPTRDHINPVELGGDFIKENIQALCVECNSRKGIKIIDDRTDYHKEMIARM